MAQMDGHKGEELVEVPSPEADQLNDQAPADTKQEGIAPKVEYDDQVEQATEWPASPDPYQWDEDELNDAMPSFRTSAPRIPTLERGERLRITVTCYITSPTLVTTITKVALSVGP